jgi:hypothetical protein
MALRHIALTTIGLALASPALAQNAGPSSTQGPITINGTVPLLCAGGTLSVADGSFDVGTLIDTSTGFLLPTLSAPSRTLSGSFCSPRSTIQVAATPMIAQNFAANPPSGFSKTVHYTATASGWTDIPATYSTAAVANPSAIQSRNSAYTGNITVSVSNFTTGGGDALRMVGDTSYLGLVTVTVAAAN